MNSISELENELGMCRQQVLQLKKENEELVISLYQVNEKLHDSERMKGHFISNITNEIVTRLPAYLPWPKISNNWMKVKW